MPRSMLSPASDSQLGRHQLKALLWRQSIFKRRDWGNSLVELVSPVVLLLLLVWAFFKADRQHLPQGIYVDDTATLLAQLSNHVQAYPALNITNCLDAATALSKTAGLNNTSVHSDPDDLFDNQYHDSGASLWSALARTPSSLPLGLAAALTSGALGTNGVNLSEILSTPTPPPSVSQHVSTLQGCLASLQHLESPTTVTSGFLETLTSLNGPLPIPTFDEYVQLHKVVSNMANGDQRMMDVIRGARREFGWNLLGNLVDMGKLAFAPDTPQVRRLTQWMVHSHEYFEETFHGIFETEAAGTKAAINDSPRLWALVVFTEGPSASGVSYTIRMNFTTVPGTMVKVAKWNHGVNEEYHYYYTSGFLSLQNAIDTYVLNLSTAAEATVVVPYSINNTTPLPHADAADSSSRRGSAWSLWGVPFPTMAYEHNEFYDAGGRLLGLVLCMCQVYALAMMIRGMVAEKETRARETMLIMGLKPWVLTTAWVTTYAIVFAFIAGAITLMCCLSFFPTTSPTLLFAFLLVFAATEVAFAVMLAAVFSRAKVAAIMGPLLHFMALMPRFLFFRTAEGQAIGAKAIASLLSPTAFTFGVDLLARYEGADEGMHWKDLWVDSLALGTIMCIMLADVAIYFALAWYLQKVLPSQYGHRESPFFMLKREYWRSRCDTDSMLPSWLHHLLPGGYPSSSGAVQYSALMSSDMEEEDELQAVENGGQMGDQPPAVVLHNLVKQYGGHTAVNNVSFQLHYNRVTALLGHNGAGKSSIVGVITGLLPPSSGQVSVCGFDVEQQLRQVRQQLGVCPQQNVLFNKMTVWEHIMLYAAIKGVQGGAWSEAAVREGCSMMDQLGLTDKKHTAAGALSGGMKRKLQVALALLAGSQVVILDEPTSGMDPVSRRGLWQLLRSYRVGRAMLLTTHYMDEADLLSDDIVVLAQGQVCATGTAMQLKEQHGHGYTLNLAVDVNGHVDRALLHDVITDSVPGSCLSRCSAAELVYQLPYDKTHAFPKLMTILDADGGSLGVCHYGLSMPTLEEVFLTVTTHKPDKSEQAPWQTTRTTITASATNRSTPVGVGYKAVRGTPSHWMRCLRQMLLKRAITTKRDKKGAVFTLLLPVLAICLVLMILKLDIDPTAPSMQLSLEHLGSISVLTANAPPELLPCMEPAYSCGSRLHMKAVQANDSYQMSMELLQEVQRGAPPSYAAFVFNDTTISGMADAQDLKDQGIVQSGMAQRAASALHDLGTQYNIAPARISSALIHRLTSYPPLTIMHNSSSWHALPAVLADLHTTLGRTANGTGISINVGSHPLPLTSSESTKLDLVLSLVAALFILVPFCYLSGSYAISPVTERAAGAHHMQLLSGCPVPMYWLGSFLWDMATHTGIALLTVLIFWLYGDQNTTGSWAQATATLLLLWLYGVAVIPLAYVYATGFNSPSVAQIAVAAINFVTGFVLVNANYIMKAIPQTRDLQKQLVHVARLFPAFQLGEGLVEISKYQACMSLRKLDPDSTFMHGICAAGAWHVFQWQVMGRALTYLALQGMACFTVVVYIDTLMQRQGSERSWMYRMMAGLNKLRHKLSKKRSRYEVVPADEQNGHHNGLEMVVADAHTTQHGNAATEGTAGRQQEGRAVEHVSCDPEVTAERSRVDSGAAQQDSICIKHLRKVYPTHPPKVAVHDLCLAVPSGQRFGFLGPNGAGKSSTLSILCGQQLPSGGDVLVGGVSVVQQQSQAAGQLGYCPQADPLLEAVTAVEQLSIYARLKGVPESHVKQEVIEVIQRVGLPAEMSLRPCGQYSGGNKRKLSLAIALIGRPVALLLDEPSSGMDPGARRDMWRAIIAATRPTGGPLDPSSGPPITVILTTHCMEECDALCSRIGIMKGGKLHCLGSPQRLKSVYGGGYQLEVQLMEEGEASGLVDWVLGAFPGSGVEEQQCGCVKFRLPKEGCSLGEVFTKMEGVKDGMGVRAYSISQPTLEQVFVHVVGDVRGLMADDNAT